MFTLATSTLATISGGYLTLVWDHLVSILGNGGIFLFGVVITVLAIVVHFAWRGLRRVAR